MDNSEKNNVTVVDVKMPFLSMVVFMVKLAIAAVPAIVILYAVGVLLAGTLGVLGSR